MQPIKPVSNQVAVFNRSGLSNQHQEGGLKGIFDIMLVVQGAAANAQDHGSVSAYQFLE
jgi:hypothetical protein